MRLGSSRRTGSAAFLTGDYPHPFGPARQVERPPFVLHRQYGFVEGELEPSILARDEERNPKSSEAMIRWASINTMTRRLARGAHTRPGPRSLAPAL